MAAVIVKLFMIIIVLMIHNMNNSILKVQLRTAQFADRSTRNYKDLNGFEILSFEVFTFHTAQQLTSRTVPSQ